MIRNIIFDMGNVLLNFDPEIPLHAFVDNDADRAIIREELFHGPEWAMADAGIITNAERFEPVSKRVPERLHPQLKQCIDEWTVCMEPLPGALNFVRAMKEKGYHLFVLSNACNMFYTYFPNHMPLTCFDGIMVSSEEKMVKPNAEIYLHFLDKYGLKAEECLFIDDRAENVEGAEGVGIRGFVFTGDHNAIAAAYDL